MTWNTQAHQAAISEINQSESADVSRVSLFIVLTPSFLMNSCEGTILGDPLSIEFTFCSF